MGAHAARVLCLLVLTALVTQTSRADDQPPVRFVALGDAGKGNDGQFQVARAMKQVCDRKGCDFALYLGDNIYEDGVSSVDDDQFQTKFEQPYAELPFLFHVVLGNHDYGESAIEFWKPPLEILYTQRSAKWRLPDFHYTFTAGNVQFLALDTNSAMLVKGQYEEQQAWLDHELATSTATWKIVLGHHPYLSNGRHGNAGRYEGCGSICPYEVNGTRIKRLVENSVCNKAQIYLSGHDHNMQWLQPKCGTEFIVSGAGASVVSLVHRDRNPTFWDSDAAPGFLRGEIRGNTFVGEFYDLNGNLLFTRTVERAQ